MAQGRGLRCGADIGGTFTDVVMVDDATGQLHIFKLLTTPDDPTRAALEGIASVLRDQGLAPEAVSTVIHGTTLVTNTLISVYWNPRRQPARWQRRSSASSWGHRACSPISVRATKSLVEEHESTAILGPRARVEVDRCLDLVVMMAGKG